MAGRSGRRAYPLRLDPGIAFGTGSHPTTKLSLAALEDYAGSGVNVLDLGCGSGILGIGALLLGCDACVGCDIDPKAKDAAMMNARLNGIGEEKIRIYSGDILKDASCAERLGGDTASSWQTSWRTSSFLYPRLRGSLWPRTVLSFAQEL